MSLSWLSAGVFAAGLAGLAGFLFLLQRLRVRHRDVEVVTTLFWREAVLDTRARVLVQRFRHPWAYVLVLAIASLAWLAVAGPRLGGARSVEHVLLLDASAGMGWGTRFEAALEALRARASELPRESTSIVVAGARIDTLLGAGEALPLFDRRAAELTPQPCAASVERALLGLFAREAPEGGREIELFGDAPVDPAVELLVPAHVRVSRIELGASERAGNCGIVAFGVREAASGAWERVDVLVRIAGDVAAGAALELTLDGQAVSGVERDATDPARWLARDVPASGGTLVARLQGGDAFGADDTAQLTLPDRPLIRVALSPAVPANVRRVLELDPGVALTEGEADVAVRASGEDFGGDVPALELTDEAAQDSAFRVLGPEADDPQAALREAFESLGLAEIDSTALAQQSGRTIELTLELRERRGVEVWSSLVGDTYDFAQSRAFPLFVGLSVRWLAGVEPIESEAAAGRFAGAALNGAAQLPDGRTLDPLDAEAHWPRAGEWSRADGRMVRVALLDPAATAALPASAFQAGANELRSTASEDLLPWIVLAALALLALEWVLVRKERMP